MTCGAALSMVTGVALAPLPDHRRRPGHRAYSARRRADAADRVPDRARRPRARLAHLNGGDATSEAVLGLSAYVAAGCTPDARTALARLAGGLARRGAGDIRQWPYGAVLPWALSRSDWHAWGAQMPDGGGLGWTLPASTQPRLVEPVAELRDGATAWAVVSPLRIVSYDVQGRQVPASSAPGGTAKATVPPGGFTMVTR